MKFRNAAGEIEFTPAAIHIDGKLRSRTRSSPTPSPSCATTSRRAVPKLTIPSPNMVHYRGGRAAVDAAVYPDIERVLGRPGRRLRRGGAPARRAGLHLPAVRRHQPGLPQRPGPARPRSASAARTPSTCTCATSSRSTTRSRTSPPAWPSPPTCAAATSARRWVAEGGYDFVAEALFSELEVDGFFLEYDDERSGGFEPLRFVPQGKMVVLGLVTTKRPELESKDDLKRRIDEAAQVRAAGPALPVAASAASPRPSRATR